MKKWLLDRRHSFLLIAMLCTFIGAFALAPASADTLVQAFTLPEHFGVNFPNQVVTFDLQQSIIPSQCYLLNDSGQEIPYQWLSGGAHGQIAFTTDLPANTTKTFSLYSGRAPATFPKVVTLDAGNPEYYQITNGLTGIRVPKVYAPLTITPKAPIQGVQFRDGAWSPPGTPISFVSNINEGGITSVDSMSVTMKEQGPIRTVIEVTYHITSPSLGYGNLKVRDDAPAHYTTTVTLEKDQPSVLFETDTDLFSTYSVSLHAGVQPTKMHYQGHHATEPINGHMADGSVYPWQHTRGNTDALVDIDYAKTREVRMTLWGNQDAINTGWYWQMYDAGGVDNSNMMGIFQGPPSRLIGSNWSGPCVYSRPGPDAGITVATNLRGPDNSLYYFMTSLHTIRFAWGLFAGTNADVPGYAAPTQADLQTVPTIAKQLCLHGNGVTLEKLAHWQLEYPDPPRPYGAAYMSQEAISKLISRARKDDAFYQNIIFNSMGSKDIWEMWRETTGDKAHELVAKVHAELGQYIDDWANGYGFPSIKYTTQPWLLPAPKLDRYDQLLGSGYLTDAEKTRIKADAAFFANWLWDYDVYPIMWDSKTNNYVACRNMGNANMPLSWIGTRSSFTWYLASHPVIATHLKEAAPNLSLISENGSHASCPHYAGCVTPELNFIMQRNMLGYHDWRDEPKLAKFAEWYLNLVTPAEVRFGGKRSIIVDGDSEPDQTPSLFAEMATACAADNPALSARLMWMWANNGKWLDEFFGASVLRVDESLPMQDPKLGNVSYRGYGAVLRNAWNTPQESAVYAFNGNWYSDHRNSTTSGQAAIYALGAPLVLGWEQMYNPSSAYSPYLRSMVVPESELGFTWNEDFPKLDMPGSAIWYFPSEGQDLFTDFTQSGSVNYHTSTRAADLTWTRSIHAIHPNADYPLIVITDAFSGAKVQDSMTFTLPLMATGTVTTPAGDVTPDSRFWDINGTQQKPSGGTPYNLSTGLNRFQFTGQQFGKAGETPAIDWDLYTVSPADQQFCIGSWGHNNAGSYRAGPDYQATNGSPYEQRQYLLHIRGTGGFKTLLVPRRKGQTAPIVTQNGGTLTVTINGETTKINDTDYSFTSTAKDILSTYDAARASAYNLSALGGPTEMVYDKTANTITITAHGTAGRRAFTVPGGGAWTVQSGTITWDAEQGKWLLSYNGNTPATAVLTGKKATPQ